VVRGTVGKPIVDILEALGLHGYKLFLVCLGLSLVIVWISWQLATWGLARKRRARP
jgi:hypothetical protein